MCQGGLTSLTTTTKKTQLIQWFQNQARGPVCKWTKPTFATLASVWVESCRIPWKRGHSEETSGSLSLLIFLPLSKSMSPGVLLQEDAEGLQDRGLGPSGRPLPQVLELRGYGLQVLLSLRSVPHAEKVTEMSQTQQGHSLFYFSKDDIHVIGNICNLEITQDRI